MNILSQHKYKINGINLFKQNNMIQSKSFKACVYRRISNNSYTLLIHKPPFSRKKKMVIYIL